MQRSLQSMGSSQIGSAKLDRGFSQRESDCIGQERRMGITDLFHDFFFFLFPYYVVPDRLINSSNQPVRSVSRVRCSTFRLSPLTASNLDVHASSVPPLFLTPRIEAWSARFHNRGVLPAVPLHLALLSHAQTPKRHKAREHKERQRSDHPLRKIAACCSLLAIDHYSSDYLSPCPAIDRPTRPFLGFAWLCLTSPHQSLWSVTSLPPFHKLLTTQRLYYFYGKVRSMLAILYKYATRATYNPELIP